MSLELFDLSGKLALVTGSSRGIGFALARGLGQTGARVILNGRDLTQLGRACDELRAEDIDAQYVSFDVNSAAAVEQAIEAIEREIGDLDVLINNAGMQDRRPLETFPVDAWHRLVETNLTSAFLVGQAVARRMLERGHGKIINICSLQSEVARPGIAPYSATKGALKMLTKGMCADWASRGIQVNAIGPGYFATELTEALRNDPEFDSWLRDRTPARRWGDVTELVGAAVFLASKASDFVNGQTIYVDGGVLAVL